MKITVKMGQKILSVLLMAVLIVGTPQFTSSAMPLDDAETDIDVEVLEATLMEDSDLNFEIMPYTMLASCIIGISGASDGLHIDISTGTVGTASVLGVKDVKIQKKTWYGGWNTVAVSSGGESYNRTTMGINILYANAVKEATYRVSCIHYGDVDGYIEGENVTRGVVYTY